MALDQINDHLHLMYKNKLDPNYTFDPNPAEEIAMVHPKLSDDDIIAAVLEDELDLPLVATESDESIAIPEIEPEPIISSREIRKNRKGHKYFR